MLVLDADGFVLDANEYTKSVAGEEVLRSKPHLYDVLVNFGNLPPFSELIGSKKSRMLNITTAAGLPQTYHFSFRKTNDTVIVFGQLDRAETETMRKNLVDANQEINNLARELHKRNAQLTQLNDLKNQFLGMAAHDLRNPIAVILQFSEFLLDETKEILTRNQIELLSNITGSSKFMLRLLNDLLDISKIESGRLELSLRSTDFVPFVERNVILNRVLAAKKKIELILDGQGNLPPLMIDRSKIEQVLNNLISNAVKYSNPGTGVYVSVSRHEGSVMVSVRDEGQGIPETEKTKLFRAFQTAGVKSTANEKSTGLGLMIAKKILAGHRGKIWVDSKPGVGSTFFFTIPVPKEELEKMRNIPSVSPVGIAERTESDIDQNDDSTFSSCLDKTVIDEYRKIDPGFLRELVEMFLEQTPRLMDRLRKAVEKKDWDGITDVADQLRGAGANIGAWQLEMICNEIVELKAGGAGIDFDNFLNELDTLYEPIKEALQKLISKLSG